ncbi:unnamed protein product [Gulo gulo]|uniref:Uncharacterized protein n=1 Tax=Gulo gulo TaxID=48420 RepID=A0A9X9LYJ7_GULGU|nr:unnamed protein product [Gulo gulo]
MVASLQMLALYLQSSAIIMLTYFLLSCVRWKKDVTFVSSQPRHPMASGRPESRGV